MTYIKPRSATTVHQWVLLVVVGIGLLMVALDITILYTALPTLARDLYASSSQHGNPNIQTFLIHGFLPVSTVARAARPTGTWR